ncbi:DUF5666 domain-containing protein [Helicobacter burdigaliensis]|uniref:DUF5666 domain-containing protein n=1 Tax=Helicobacter burdigaliensis TaxID=2315334 RepID=UPI000EF678B5|nr:DUF5666 domain-containing protein [Helicobacter burdigaliensis]
MKKFLAKVCLLGMCVVPAFADSDMDISGQIMNVNDVNKTITLSGMNGNVVIKVFPYTEIKGDDCGMFGNDTHEKFVALKPGMFVQVDAIPQADGTLGAKEIEWKCGHRAY